MDRMNLFLLHTTKWGGKIVLEYGKVLGFCMYMYCMCSINCSSIISTSHNRFLCNSLRETNTVLRKHTQCQAQKRRRHTFLCVYNITLAWCKELFVPETQLLFPLSILLGDYQALCVAGTTVH